MIISFRENMLASMVSSWELTCTEREKCKKNMKGTFEEEDLLKKNVHALEIDYAMYFAEMVELYVHARARERRCASEGAQAQRA